MSRPYFNKPISKYNKKQLLADIRWLSNTYNIPTNITLRSRRQELYDELQRVMQERTPSYYSIRMRFKWSVMGQVQYRQNLNYFETVFTTRTRNPTAESLYDEALNSAIAYAQARSSINYEIEVEDLEIISITKIDRVNSLANIRNYGYRLSYPNLNLFDSKEQSNYSCEGTRSALLLLQIN
jgi:hypothetical protein